MENLPVNSKNHPSRIGSFNDNVICTQATGLSAADKITFESKHIESSGKAISVT